MVALWMIGFGDDGDGGVWLAMFPGGQLEEESYPEGSGTLVFLSVSLVNLFALR